jgi:hypothetical protein
MAEATLNARTAAEQIGRADGCKASLPQQSRTPSTSGHRYETARQSHPRFCPGLNVASESGGLVLRNQTISPKFRMRVMQGAHRGRAGA